MANKFVRSMNDVNRKEDELPLDLTNENDLISTKEKQHYIRRKDDYHCLTDNVKSMKLNGKVLKPDLIKNQVTSPNLAEEVNGVKVSSNGKVTIDTGVMSVNGQKPDSKGDIVVTSETPPQITGKSFIEYDDASNSYKISLHLTTLTETTLKTFKDFLKLDDNDLHLTINLSTTLGSDYTIKTYALPNSEVIILDVNYKHPEIRINKKDLEGVNSDGYVGSGKKHITSFNYVTVNIIKQPSGKPKSFPFITIVPLNVFDKIPHNKK